MEGLKVGEVAKPAGVNPQASRRLSRGSLNQTFRRSVPCSSKLS